ncbi:TetR family transcriptional regulator [Kineococcus rhizosphaerae]|uniref:TetR family transcriptional regulator n=1 Tax=Kineococcus rhizosphaerae TaxID=559628 RepID=A0A2T0R2P1_9ACTN|nr:TetR family transcriptional regulator [Kineococcus rhizosphaerae]PRY14054.1 TetR family transcriptional regulator [Kineococcus rhizosphaerae]
MAGDAEATRGRLLEAATAEFSARGLAGARVDRIAAAAGSNKAQIYHYFGSKDGLFTAVFDAIVTRTTTDVPIDVDDLPGYAGRLHDSYAARPEVQRIAAWHRLEHSGSDPREGTAGGGRVRSIQDANRAKVEAIAAAQADGRLPERWSAAELLGLVLQISTLWHAAVPELDDLTAGSARHRRDVVVDAVRRLLAD